MTLLSSLLFSGPRARRLNLIWVRAQHEDMHDGAVSGARVLSPATADGDVHLDWERRTDGGTGDGWLREPRLHSSENGRCFSPFPVRPFEVVSRNLNLTPHLDGRQ